MSRFYFLLFVFLSFSCHADSGRKLEIFVSIPPQKFLVERIGGERVHVNVMLQPGQSPETYDPAPKQIAMLSGAQVYFCIGVPFEKHWLDRISGQNRKMYMVDSYDSMLDDNDPHIWTDPANAKRIAGHIKDTLIKLDPAESSLFTVNYRLLISDLNRLDRDIRAMLAHRKTDYFIVSHGSWGYFARRYGLKQLALESLGRELGPRGLSELVTLARQEGIHTVFIQRQHPARTADTLARELDASIVTLDPLAEEYIGNLYSVGRQIAEAVK